MNPHDELKRWDLETKRNEGVERRRIGVEVGLLRVSYVIEVDEETQGTKIL